jgi:hypothetical protein
LKQLLLFLFTIRLLPISGTNVTLDRESGRGDGELARDGGGGAQVEPEARLTESVPLPPDPKCV